MATGTTTNLGLTTVEAGDTLPEAISKANLETLDQYVAARSLTNKSGSQRVAGEVVVADTTADSAFTTTTTAANPKVIGVVQATIANDAAGIVKQFGVSSVLVTGATSRGNWLTTSTTAGQAAPSSQTNPPPGAFGIALSASVGAGSVTAVIFGGITVGITTRQIDLPAFSGFSPTSNGAADGSTHGTNHSYRTKDYDQSTEEHIDFEVVIPDTYTGGNLTWKMYWTAASGSGGVAWEVNVASVGDDDVFDSAKTDVGSATDTLITAGDIHVTSVVQSSSLPTAGEAMTVRISRDVADAADTLNADAKLVRVIIEIPDNVGA